MSTTTPIKSSAKRPATRAEAALSRFHEESKLGQSYDVKNLGRIWPFVKPHARHLVLSIALLLFSSGLAMVRPLLMRAAFEGFDGADPQGTLTRCGLILGAVLLSEQLIAFPQMYFMQLAGARAMADLRRHVFAFLHTRRLGFFVAAGTRETAALTRPPRW